MLAKTAPVTVIFVLFLFVSCYQDITLDLEEPDIRPVVFGMAKAGKPIDVIVQKSYSLLTFTDTLDKNIKTDISLFVNDEFKEVLYIKNNHYYSQYIPQFHDKLKISFQWKGREISAKSTIPEPINIDSVKYIRKNSDGSKSFYLYFKDNEQASDYYELAATALYSNDTMHNIVSFLWLNSKSPLIGNEEDMTDYYSYRSMQYSDTLFNGKKLALLFDISGPYLNENEILHNITLSLSIVSREYYLYEISFMKNQRAQTPDIFFGDTEYINVYSNITNGYGFFKTLSTDKKDITSYFK